MRVLQRLCVDFLDARAGFRIAFARGFTYSGGSRVARRFSDMLKTPPGGAFPLSGDRRIYILWIALIWAAILAGFVPDLKRYFDETPAPPWVLHVHGVVTVLWLTAVTLQIVLAEIRKPALHRQLGWWVAGLSVALIPLGLVAAMVDMARSAEHPGYEPQFLATEYQSVVVFAILLRLAIRLRRDHAGHKRLMILLAVSILDPGTARAWGYFSPIHLTGPLGFAVQNIWGSAAIIILMMAWDLVRHRRIHPSLLFGAVLIEVGNLVAIGLQFAPWWHDIAAKLVLSWGWTG